MRRERTHLMGVVVSFVAVLATAYAARAEAFIVKDGEPRAEIVTAAQPPRMAALAAEQLQTYVRRISGAALPITTAPSPQVPVQIYIGRSPHTDRLNLTVEDLDHGAYRMVSADGRLVLLGRDTDFSPPEPWMYSGSAEAQQQFYRQWDAITGHKWSVPFPGLRKSYNSSMDLWEQDERGSLNAVYAFLRHLGVRWYFPGEVGEFVPKMDTIALPEVDRTVRPDFPVRRIMLYGMHFSGASRDEVLWQLRLGLTGGHEGVPDGLMGLGAPGHGILRVIGREGIKEAHPEYFAIWAGERVRAPCLSSPELQKEATAYVRAVYDQYDHPRVDLSPTDGYGSLCQCPLCEGKSTPERGMKGLLSDYVWGFVDRVAREAYKTHPDHMLGGLAYSTYQLPPEKIDRMSPNVSIMICRWRSNFVDPETRQWFRDLTRAWLDKLPSDELYIWDYYLHSRWGGTWHGVPAVFPHIISDDLRFLKGKSKGEFIEVAANRPADANVDWEPLAVNHLNVYITSRLYWDADQDVDAMLDDYYTKFYGPARSEMKKFIEYAITNWPKAPKDVKVIDRLTELLGAAREAVDDGTVYARRIDMLVNYMQPLVDRRSEIGKGREGVPQAGAASREWWSEEVTLDGKLDESFWEGVPAYALKELETGAEPAHRSWFKVAWAGESLYFGIQCTDADMENLNVAAKRDEDTNIWLGDSVEILLETQSHSYYQIAISPAGAVVDLDRKKGLESLWSAKAQVGTHIGEDHWNLEVRIPVLGEGQEELDPLHGVSGRKPTPDYPWYFNVCRQRVRGGEIQRSAFSPTGSRSFHVLNKFAELFVE